LKIVFAIKALGNQGGGAERVLVEIASGLVQLGHEVTVLTNDPIGTVSYYALHHLVRQINLGIGKGKTTLFETIKRILVMRHVLVQLKPDVAIGFMHSTYIPLGFALKGTGIPLIASEHTSYEHYKNRIVERLLLYITPLISEQITVVSNQIRLAFGSWLRRHMFVIPNPVNLQINRRANVIGEEHTQKILLSVGRLGLEKNHKCLISAFALIANSVQDWNLRIVGEGELRSELESQIEHLNLKDRVQLPGAISDIDYEYINAQLFVLPSLYESFGLATAEAIIHGLPAIGFADCPGTNQLILHNENGLLVSGKNRIQALADALRFLMLNPTERYRLSSVSTDWLIEQFGREKILKQWESLLNQLLKQ